LPPKYTVRPSWGGDDGVFQLNQTRAPTGPPSPRRS
jgi:hypothetical protein